MKLGFVFPGQGSQFVGMGKDYYEKYECVRNVYDKASQILGFDIAKLSFEGPEEELNQNKQNLETEKKNISRRSYGTKGYR